MRRKKKDTIYMLLIMILGLTIGFALLSTTLKINGIAGIKSNSWNVYWDSASISVNDKSVSTEKPTVGGTNNDTVSYTVELELPGDFYEFTIDAVNAGTVDAMISDNVKITYKEGKTTIESLPSYLISTVTYGDDEAIGKSHLLAKATDVDHPTRENYKIRIEYDSKATTLPPADKLYTINIEIPYTQADKTAKDRHASAFEIKTQEDESKLSLGDRICIDTECFRVLTSDATTTKMISEYNLLLGYTCSTSEKNSCLLIPDTTDKYGLQSETARGAIDSDAGRVGTLAFAPKDYWYGKVGNIGDEGIVYQGKVTSTGHYSDDYENYEAFSVSPPYVYDENSSLYVHVNNYVNTLKTMGAPSTITGRIMKYEEAYTLFGCEMGSCSKYGKENGKYDFLFETAFWLGNASVGSECIITDNYSSLYAIASEGGETAPSVTQMNAYGVRPVIEVPTSALLSE